LARYSEKDLVFWREKKVQPNAKKNFASFQSNEKF
jgi:hypothetical protein